MRHSALLSQASHGAMAYAQFVYRTERLAAKSIGEFCFGLANLNWNRVGRAYA